MLTEHEPLNPDERKLDIFGFISYGRLESKNTCWMPSALYIILSFVCRFVYCFIHLTDVNYIECFMKSHNKRSIAYILYNKTYTLQLQFKICRIFQILLDVHQNNKNILKERPIAVAGFCMNTPVHRFQQKTKDM